MNCTNSATRTDHPGSGGKTRQQKKMRRAQTAVDAPHYPSQVEREERRPPPVVATQSGDRKETTPPVRKRNISGKPITPSKKEMWWVDDRMRDERAQYDTKFNRRLGIEAAYSMKLAKLKKQRERELIGKCFKNWKNKHEMQSGIESAILGLQDKIGDTEVCDIAESVLLLTYNLARASSVMDYVVAAISFMKGRSPGPMLSKAFRREIVPFVKSLLSDSSILEMQAGLEEKLTSAKDVLAIWPRLKSSPLWRKVNAVVVFTTAMALFGPEVTRTKALKVEEQYYTSKHMLRADFVHNVLDLLLFVSERGLQVVKSKTFDPMFHSGSAYEKWYDEAADIVAKSKFLSNPEVHGIDVHSFTGTLDDLIRKGQSMYKYACELDRGAKKVVQGTVAQLLAVRAMYLNKKVGQRTRKAPLAIVLEGHSSVGKTTYANLLHYYYGTLRGKNTSIGSRYTRMSTSEFWNSFSSDQWSLLIDDAASFKPNAINEIDPSVKELLQIVNNAPLSANMASLEEKGNCPFLGELVVATTNTPDLNLEHYFNAPGAVARRFPYHVRIRPRKEYSKNATMLDEAKVESVEPGRYPDWWDIEILEPVLQPASLDAQHEFKMSFELVSTHKGMRMKEFIKWYHGVIVKHNTIQDKVALSEESLRTTGLCSGCHLPSGMCDCEQVEEGTEILFGDIAVPLENQAGFEMQSGDEEWGWSWVKLFHDNLLTQVLWCATNYALFSITLMNNITLAYLLLSLVFSFRRFFFEIWHLGPSARAFVLVTTFVERMAHNWRVQMSRRIGNVAEAASTAAWRATAEGKALLKRCGDRVVAVYFDLPRICKLIIAVLSVALVALGVYLSFRDEDVPHEVQGPLLSTIGSTPKSAGEAENAWERPVYTPSTYDLGRFTLSWKNVSEDDTKRVLARNSCFIRFQSGEGWKVAKCVALGGQYFMTTNHTLGDFQDGLKCELVRSKNSVGVTNTVRFALYNVDVKRNLDKDLVIFRCRSAPPARKIVDLFIRNKLTGFRGDGYYLGRNTDGSIFDRTVRGIYEGQHYNPALKKTLPIFWGLISKPTEYGDCGAMLVARTGSGPVILGLHQLGDNGRSVGAIRITYEDIMELMGDEFMVGDSEPMLDAPSTAVGLPGPVHPKSPVNFMEEGTLDCHGSFDGWRSDAKFNVKTSILASALAKHGYEVAHGAPVAKGWKPKYNTLVELAHLHPSVDVSVVDKAVDGFVSDLRAIDPKWKKEIMIYDMHTAMNGVPGLKYVDGIKRSTSAGFPYGKPKQVYLEQLEPTKDYPDHVTLTPEVCERVEEVLRRYSDGNRAGTVFRAAFKNEPLPLEKVAKGKVRTFMMASIELTVVMRMYTLSFTRVAQSNHFLFECAPGIEAQSCEWDFLYQYLTRFGKDQCVFGDFQGYDKSMHPVFILGAFEVIARFHEYAGATKEHVNVIRCIAADIAFAHVDFFGDLVTLFGKNPSGQALTAIINGLVNSLYMRFVWIHCDPRGDVMSFKMHVALITYGDDNGMGVSKSAPFFNHTSIAAVLKSELGVGYTMADKESASVPYVNIDKEGSFLKRSWRYEEETGTYMAPLELASLAKMLMVVVPSDVVSPEVQAVDTLRSANAEYFWHGRAVFENKHRILKEVARECGLEPHFQKPLESWHELMERYIASSTDFVARADIPDYVSTKSYKFLTMQSGEEEGTFRLCLVCGAPRFDEMDMDCGVCGENDTCEMCGETTSDVSQHPQVAYRYGYHPWLCIRCRVNRCYGRQKCIRCAYSNCEIWWFSTLDDITQCKNCGRCTCSDGVDMDCPACIDVGTDDNDLLSDVELDVYVRDEAEARRRGYGRESGDEVPSQTTHTDLISAPQGSLTPGVNALSVDAVAPVPRPTIGALGGRIQASETELRAEPRPRDERPTEFQHKQFHLQSGMEGGNEQSTGGDVMSNPSPAMSTHQTATFMDSGVGDTLSFAETQEAIFTYDRQTNVDLGDFLSRPKLIQTVTWTPGALSTSSFDPWSLYLGSTEIVSKLNNFAFFRGTLRVKVVLNAAPFYYGALMMYYTPLPTRVLPLSSNPGVKIQQSQRPHIWILPQNNEGGEMTIPFIYPKNYVAITSAAEVATLGTLTLTAYSQLGSANGATSNGVQMQIYAWLEDVSLFGPTSGLAMQAGDEYGNGPVSAPAAAMAHWATYLSRVPYIGRFAKATSIGASAVSQVAKLFGWTNVPVITDVQPYKNVPFHDLASAHISEPTSKFSLDPKGELSVDPALVGIGGTDELSMSHLVQKESYLAAGTWTAGGPAGSIIFSTQVTPMLQDVATPSGAGTYAIHSVPMAWASAPFANWRGDIIFRFKVICSKFHSGRLRIHWDPVATMSSTADLTHVTYTAILDIQESDEIEFRVPYMQALSWLPNKFHVATSNVWSTSAAAGNDAFSNGTLTMRVLNNLSAPIDTASCTVLVFVRGAENLEFANPRDLSPLTSIFGMQSGTEPCQTKSPMDERYLVNWGEPVPSVRLLLRRSTLVDRVVFPKTIVSTDESGIIRIRQSRLPPPPGYDASAYTAAKGVETPATTYAFSFTNQTYLAWYSAAFVALRGGVRWHYNMVNPDGTVPHNIVVTRNVGNSIGGGVQDLEATYISGAAATATNQSKVKGGMWKASGLAGLSGLALTNPLTQTGVSVEMPMMTNYIFQMANPRNWLLGSSFDGSNTDNYAVDVDIHPAQGVGLNRLQMHRYVSAGTDFTLHMFLNTPVVYYNVGMGGVPA